MTDPESTPLDQARAAPDPATLAARVAQLEADLAAARDQLGAARQELEATRAGLADATRQGLEHLRRALVAEHAGQIVPELVTGTTPDELAASVETARAAFARAAEAARQQLQAHATPAGNPPRSAEDLSALPAIEKIARGLTTSGR